MTILRTLASLVAAWAVTALLVDGKITWLSVPAAACLVVLGLWIWREQRRAGRRVALSFAASLLTMVWWMGLQPLKSGNYSGEFAEQPWAEIGPDKAIVHNVRNFSYRTEHDYTPRWETRFVDLRRLEGADIFLSHWGIPLVAHAIVSFRFSDGSFLATSIEARRQSGQEFSAWRGFFRRYTVTFLVADERDVVQVRTNFRQGENVFLYRTRLRPADARILLSEYFRAMNELRDHPRWYNALANNCGSFWVGELAGKKIGGISRWDWRTLFDGNADAMLYELGDLESHGLTFPELKAQALINPAAQASENQSGYSQHIRQGRAGLQP